MSPSATEPVRLGIVGCGRAAQTHLEALERVPALRLVAVCDVREERGRSVAARYGGTACGDARRLGDADRLDAVLVCTPPSTHCEIAGSFLDQGVHVLCEKPLAVSSREAEALVAKAQGAKRLLMMASKFRYVDDVIEGKAILDSGALGDAILYENVFCSKVDMRHRWNASRAIGGGGVLIDNGTHSVDIARFLLGPIVQVQAEAGRSIQGLEVEDTCRLYLRTGAGAMGAVDLSWSIEKERDAYIEVFGSKGMLSIGWRGSKYRRSEGTDWITFGKGYDKVAAFAHQLRNFAASIHEVEAPRITAEDGLESVRVIEAAYQSMEMDKWIPVGNGETAP